MNIEKFFKQLKREFWKVNSLQASLDAITFFLVGNLVLFLFSLDIIAGVRNLYVLATASVVLFFIDLILRSRKYNIEIYEQKNPELQEILRTARDNINSRDTVSQALFQELKDRSQKVTSESIIPSTRILQKIFIVGALSFITVLSGLADFQIAELEEDIVEDLGELEDVIQDDDQDDELDIRDGEEIMGEEEDIQSSENLIDYDIEGEAERSESDFEEDGGEGAENPVLDSSTPETSEDLQLAKQYSLAIRNTEQD